MNEGNPKVFMAFTHTKKVDIGSFIKAKIRIRVRSQTSGSGSDQKGPDPTGSGSATLLVAHRQPDSHTDTGICNQTKHKFL
jgi:hypothetical protein